MTPLRSENPAPTCFCSGGSFAILFVGDARGGSATVGLALEEVCAVSRHLCPQRTHKMASGTPFGSYKHSFLTRLLESTEMSIKHERYLFVWTSLELRPRQFNFSIQLPLSSNRNILQETISWVSARVGGRRDAPHGDEKPRGTVDGAGRHLPSSHRLAAILCTIPKVSS